MRALLPVSCSALAPCFIPRPCDAEPINLLELPIARLEHATDPRADDALLKALADGNATKAVTLTSADAAPVSLVIGFGGNLASLQSIEISLGEAAGTEQRAASVDVLVSELSPVRNFSRCALIC